MAGRGVHRWESTVFGREIAPHRLSDEYVEALFTQYDGKVPAEADLVCYWFDKAQRTIEAGKAQQGGLLATQGIRGGANRRVLQRIKETGDIFVAWSDHHGCGRRGGAHFDCRFR